MPERYATIRSESVTRQRRKIPHHVRHRVTLLLGFYNIHLHTGIVRYAREAEWALDDNYIRVGVPLAGWRGDGILALITNPKDVLALHRLPKQPMVDLSMGWISDSMPATYRRGGTRCPRVYYDNERIGRMAAKYFLERGYRHIAYQNYGNFWMEQGRIPAFRATIEKAGCTFHEIPYYSQVDHASASPEEHKHAHKWLVKALRDLPKPIGIAVSVDNIANQLLQACADAGVSVPEEVAVLGCDNDPMVCDYALVPLSSVDIDWERIGYEGAALLDRLMSGEPAPKAPIVIPPKEIVTRMSTNILAVPDPRIARAILFIWENFDKNIGTAEVAAVAGINRRKLERDFLKQLGQTVNAEIAHTRIENAKSQLRNTDLKACEIAEACGFSGISYFSKIFSRITGVCPSEYRREHQVNESSV